MDVRIGLNMFCKVHVSTTSNRTRSIPNNLSLCKPIDNIPLLLPPRDHLIGNHHKPFSPCDTF